MDMEEEKAVTYGRPSHMEDPRGVSVVLDRCHREAVNDHKVNRGFRTFAEAMRDIIERFERSSRRKRR